MERPAFAGRSSFVDIGDKIPDRRQDFGREFFIGRNPGKADAAGHHREGHDRLATSFSFVRSRSLARQ
jgi:hypothetical protein